MRLLSRKEVRWFRNYTPQCQVLRDAVENISDFFALIDSTLAPSTQFFFRGHARANWALTPSALRPGTKEKRDAALSLLAGFKRTVLTKIRTPPDPHDNVTWLGLAQHYGLPTRLLDWTENPAIALYFACQHEDEHGACYVLNPLDLNRVADPKRPRIFDPHQDKELIESYLRLGSTERRNGRRTIAIYSVYDNERVLLQRGTFTLHGSRRFELNGDQAPSLVSIPILSDVKRGLKRELDRIGVNEMSIFPEPEHLCHYLKDVAGINT